MSKVENPVAANPDEILLAHAQHQGLLIINLH